MRMEKPNYRQFHPLPILTQHPSYPKPHIGLVGPEWTRRPAVPKPGRDYTIKPAVPETRLGRWDKGGRFSFSMHDLREQSKRNCKACKKACEKCDSICSPWERKILKGGSWKSKWYLTKGQNQRRRRKLKKKCLARLKVGDADKKYRNNCKDIIEDVGEYLDAVRQGQKYLEKQHRFR